MLSIPMRVLVALNIVRVFAVLFLMLAAEGRLSGPFPYSAAWGDIITGAAAVPLLWLLKDDAVGRTRRHTTTIATWNLFGAPGSLAMQFAPWSFVPTVLVPIWLILHAIIAVKLRRGRLSPHPDQWRDLGSLFTKSSRNSDAGSTPVTSR
jgi:hypothetical protein